MPNKPAPTKSGPKVTKTTRPKPKPKPVTGKETGKGKGKAKAKAKALSPSPSPSPSPPEGSSPSAGSPPAEADATPSQQMELVLRDIAKANAARRVQKRKAVLDGYISAVEEVVKRRAGRWMEEGEVMEKEWRGSVVGRLAEVMKRKEVLEERICNILEVWEEEVGRVVEVAGEGVKAGCEGSGDDDEEEVRGESGEENREGEGNGEGEASGEGEENWEGEVGRGCERRRWRG